MHFNQRILALLNIVLWLWLSSIFLPCNGDDQSDVHCFKKNERAFFISGFIIGWSIFTASVFGLALFYLPCTPLDKFLSRRRKKKKKIKRVIVQGSQLPIANNNYSKISKWERLLTKISFVELRSATDNFSKDKIIGLGKTGIMYKAVLPNGCLVAIKKFCDSQCSIKDFVSELTTLGRLRHRNVIPLLGFCCEAEEKILVYKYMSNGNLYDWLHSQNSETIVMNWPLRVKIGIGLARGLVWLHHNRNFRVFHRNITSKCILLNQNFEAKITNFEEAKFMNPNVTPSLNHKLLELGFLKMDVYSFGVVLLELMTTKQEPSKETDDSSSEITSEHKTLFDWIINLSSSSFSLLDAVDNSLIGLGFDDEIFQFLLLERRCVQSFPNQRPSISMLEVYQTMRAIGEKHGIVDDSEMWKQIEAATASGRVENTSRS